MSGSSAGSSGELALLPESPLRSASPLSGDTGRDQTLPGSPPGRTGSASAHGAPDGAVSQRSVTVLVRRRPGEALGLKFDGQMRVVEVAAGSAAEAAGVRVGQWLLAVGGQQTQCFGDVRRALGAAAAPEVRFVLSEEQPQPPPEQPQPAPTAVGSPPRGRSKARGAPSPSAALQASPSAGGRNRPSTSPRPLQQQQQRQRPAGASPVPPDWLAAFVVEQRGASSTLAAAEWDRLRGEVAALSRAAAEAAARAQKLDQEAAELGERERAAEAGARDAARLAGLLFRARGEGAVGKAEAAVKQLQAARGADLASFQQEQTGLKRELRRLRDSTAALHADPARAPPAPDPERLRAAVQGACLRDEAAALREARDALRLRVQQHEQGAAEKRELLRQSDRKQARVRQELRAARTRLEATKGEYDALGDGLKQLAARQVRAKEEHGRAMKKLQSRARGEGQDRERLLAAAQEERERAQRRIDRLAEEADQLRREHRTLQGQAQEKQQQADELRARLDESEQDVAAARRERARARQLEREQQDLQRRIEAAQAECERMRERGKKAEEEERRQAGLMAEKTKALRETEQAVAAAREEAARASAAAESLRQFQNEAHRLEEELRQEHDSALDVADELHRLEGRLAAAQEARRAALRCCAELEGAMREARCTAEALKGDLAAKERQHAQDVRDRETDAAIRLRKARALRRELYAEQEQLERLELALAHAQAAQAQAAAAPQGGRRSSLAPQPLATPRAAAAPSDSSGTAPRVSGAAWTYRELSEENCKLLARLAALKDQAWAAGEAKREAQLQLLRVQAELRKKDAALRFWGVPAQQGNGEHFAVGLPPSTPQRGAQRRSSWQSDVTDRLQHVVEELVWGNLSLQEKSDNLAGELEQLREAATAGGAGS